MKFGYTGVSGRWHWYIEDSQGRVCESTRGWYSKADAVKAAATFKRRMKLEAPVTVTQKNMPSTEEYEAFGVKPT